MLENGTGGDGMKFPEEQFPGCGMKGSTAMLLEEVSEPDCPYSA
jgi:hypothetical protein